VKLPMLELKLTPQNTKTTPSAIRIATAKMPFSLSWMVCSMCLPGPQKTGR
jgi:hypothetical protein